LRLELWAPQVLWHEYLHLELPALLQPALHLHLPMELWALPVELEL
jgi:hypothetical protein